MINHYHLNKTHDNAPFDPPQMIFLPVESMELDPLLIHLDVKELAIQLTQAEDNSSIDIIAFARQFLDHWV